MRRGISAAAVFSLKTTLVEASVATTGRTPIVHLFNLSLFIADGHVANLAWQFDTRRDKSQIKADAFHGNTTFLLFDRGIRPSGSLLSVTRCSSICCFGNARQLARNNTPGSAASPQVTLNAKLFVTSRPLS
jgi:hypothetical protein